jgi:hypothetical protein
MADGRSRLAETFRSIAFGLERMAAEEAATSAARGALDELERQWTDGGLPLHGVVQRVDRLLEDVRRMAESWDRDSADPAARAREVTAEIVRTGVAELLAASRDAGTTADLSRSARAVGFALGAGVADGLAAGVRPHVRAITAQAVAGGADGALAAVRRRLSSVPIASVALAAAALLASRR